MTQMSKKKAYQVIGWCMLGYAFIDIIACALQLAEYGKTATPSSATTFVYVAAIAIAVLDAFFYVLAGIAGIKTNFKMGKAAWIAQIVIAVISLISVIASKRFTSDDYRIILMPVLYGSFMFYAQKEVSQQ
ncbi:MAG: hypothetical protein ACI4WX_00395 [Aristaeellaceae bacterium]